MTKVLDKQIAIGKSFKTGKSRKEICKDLTVNSLEESKNIEMCKNDQNIDAVKLLRLQNC